MDKAEGLSMASVEAKVEDKVSVITRSIESHYRSILAKYSSAEAKSDRAIDEIRKVKCTLFIILAAVIADFLFGVWVG